MILVNNWQSNFSYVSIVLVNCPIFSIVIGNHNTLQCKIDSLGVNMWISITILLCYVSTAHTYMMLEIQLPVNK